MIELKAHNQRSYAELCEALEAYNAVAYISATGTGKTYVGGKYIEDRELEAETLILVPSDAIKIGWKGILPEVEVMTYQAMLKNKPDMGEFKLLICDEMHHLGAEEWGKHYKQMIEEYDGKIIGMSATPIRFLDNSRDMVDELFDGVQVLGLELPEVIEQRVLPTFDYIAALYDLPSYRPKAQKGKSHNEALTDQLFKRLDTMENELSFQNIIRKHMKPGTHKVAVFVPQISELQKYRRVVEGVYPDALHTILHSGMTEKQTRDGFNHFESHEGMAFIYTVDMLNEGVHTEGVDTVIMFRRTESPTIFLQQLGRALTTNNAAERITVFDFVANHKRISGKREGNGDVIDWINGGIGDPARQVVKSDYAKDAREVLDRINDLLSNKWTAEEDDILRQYYDQGKGIDKVCEILPYRNRHSIVARASKLKLGKQIFTADEEIKADLMEHYGNPSGKEFLLQKYPEYSWKKIRALAYREGMIVGETNTLWTEEEDELIRQNVSIGWKALAKLLPGRTAVAVKGRGTVLGLTKPRQTWTEEYDRVLSEHAGMPSNEIQENYLPLFSTSSINRRKKVLGMGVYSNSWPKDKIDRFVAAYTKGGINEVISLAEFSGMNKKAIVGAAQRYGIHRDNPSAWTETEMAAVKRYLNGECSKSALFRSLPGRSKGSVNTKAYVMKREAISA